MAASDGIHTCRAIGATCRRAAPRTLRVQCARLHSRTTLPRGISEPATPHCLCSRVDKIPRLLPASAAHARPCRLPHPDAVCQMPPSSARATSPTPATHTTRPSRRPATSRRAYGRARLHTILGLAMWQVFSIHRPGDVAGVFNTQHIHQTQCSRLGKRQVRRSGLHFSPKRQVRRSGLHFSPKRVWRRAPPRCSPRSLAAAPPRLSSARGSCTRQGRTQERGWAPPQTARRRGPIARATPGRRRRRRPCRPCRPSRASAARCAPCPRAWACRCGRRVRLVRGEGRGVSD